MRSLFAASSPTTGGRLPRFAPIHVLGAVVLGLAVVLAVLAAIFLMGRPQPTAWQAFGFDAASTRSNPDEHSITAGTVHGLRLLWRTRLPAVADSSPAYLPAVPFPDGRVRGVLYFTTTSGSLIALDADTGAQLWMKQNRTAGPRMLTTSSPFADPSRQTVYSYGLDGKVHAYQAASGTEEVGHGWPVTVTTMPATEKISSALSAAHGELYVTTASLADVGSYQGHVVAIDLGSGSTHVFNTLCSAKTHLLAPGACREDGGGIWARPGVVVDSTTGNLYVATGNGPYTADRGGDDWGESVLELTSESLQLVDSYTVPDPNALSPQDLDVGSAAPALLPVVQRGMVPDLAAQAGKDGELRLLNRRNLSGQGGPGHTGGALQTLDAPNHCPVLTQPAVWTDVRTSSTWVLVANACAIGGYQVVTTAAGTTALKHVWEVGVGASSPLVAGGVLFAATTGDKQLIALDPRTGHQLWTSADATAGGTIGNVHWESPIVVGGRLYCADENGQVAAYGLVAPPYAPHVSLPRSLLR
jgi:outer membrane protein assembly factor BamB